MPKQSTLIAKIDDLNREAYKLRYTETKRSLLLSEETNHLATAIDYKEGLARSLMITVVCQFRMGNHETALMKAEEAIQIHSMNQDAENKVNVQSLMGNIYFAQCNFQQALNSFSNCADYYRQIGAGCNQAISYTQLGAVYHRLGDYENALDYHFKSLKISKELHSRHTEASSLHNIAAIYSELRDNDNAIRFFIESSKIFRELGDTAFEANNYNSIALIFNTSGNHAKGLEYAFKSLKLHESAGNKDGMSAALGSIGECYDDQGNLVDALAYFSKSEETAEQIGSKWRQAESLKKIGSIYLKQNKIRYALDHLQKALVIAEEIESKRLIYETHEILAYICQEMDDFKQAFSHHEQFHGIKESLFNEKSDHRIRMLQIRFETEQKENENRLYRLKIEQQRNELAEFAQTIARQNTLVQTLKKELDHFNKDSTQTPENAQKQISALLDAKKISFQNWTAFQKQFDSVFPDFNRRLVDQYPSITSQKIKICMLIKLKLTSRKIAGALYISQRCVDWHRYQIRKKLQLSPEKDLYLYLSKY